MRFFLSLLICCLAAGKCPALEMETGGHLRLHAGMSVYGSDHIMTLSGPSGPFLDQTLDFRYKSGWFLSDRIDIHLHYVACAETGDTRRAVSRLPLTWQPFRYRSGSDDTQLLDLASDTGSDRRHFTHSLDRLYARYGGNTASLSIGRQAVTTGNGLIFNPMDLINPFAPSDVIRDYKTGTDMAVCQFSWKRISDGMLIWVPRRNSSGQVDTEASSFALRLKTFLSSTEAGIMLARHYSDNIIGVSFSGFAGAAAWRTDLMWTDPAQTDLSGFASAIVNIDYSWTVNDKNWYALLEFYHSGLGEKDIMRAQKKQALQSRIQRGDVYHTATKYAGVQIQNEIQPLVTLAITAIVNLDDGSALFQPSVRWNVAQSVDILMGVNFLSGGPDTEFTGATDPYTGRNTGPASQFYIQGTWYF